MQLLSWLRQRIGGQPHIRQRRKYPLAPRCRPRLEALEDRWLPSTLTVLNTNDSGPGSLRAEIAAARSGDTIVFDKSLAGQAINLTSGELLIDKSLTIQGPSGANSSGVGISANDTSRIFDITSSAWTVTLAKLGIGGGAAAQGGGIYNAGATVNLTADTIAGNGLGGESNGSFSEVVAVNEQGGGIYNAGTMTISGCS